MEAEALDFEHHILLRILMGSIAVPCHVPQFATLYLHFSGLLPSLSRPVHPSAVGAAGGFAGGEQGVKVFAATGEIKLRKPGQPGGQPMSPLIITMICLLGGGVGGVLLSTIFDAGEGIVKEDIVMVRAYTNVNATSSAAEDGMDFTHTSGWRGQFGSCL
jgi:hypothetical protein